MSKFLDAFSDIDGAVIIFMIVFSVFLAAFHTLLVKSFITEKLPGWLFFVLNPALIALGFLIHKPLGGVVFLTLAISVFFIALGGWFFQFVKDTLYSIREERKKHPWWKVILKLLGSLALIALFFALGPYIFPVIIAIIILSKILPNSNNRFLKLQSVLPTSKIRSMAMGLVEVKGKLRKIEYLKAPIKSKPCIGYTYIIEKKKRDDNGRTKYSTISNISKCNNFFIEDETGSVEVAGEDLEFMWLDVSDSYESGGKRYSQYLITEGDEMLLIGKADREGDKVIITKEEIKKTFMMSPVGSVDRWNKYQPLLRSFLSVSIVIAIIAMIILLADISVDGNTVHFRMKEILFDWNNLWN
ncbi:MAG: hypothetical protein E6772_11445 [Dysgonomonas sp.]|nr:hypothetical protein [Dysgonomonas sp.]